MGASLGTFIYHKGSRQVRELFSQPAAKDSLASSYLGSGTAATLSEKADLWQLPVHTETALIRNINTANPLR